MRVTDSLNKLNINVMDKIKVNNNYEGGTDIELTKDLHGHVAKVTPTPLGLMNIEYGD